jgi:hypothetical protein
MAAGSGKMRRDLPAVRPVAVFEEIDPLPGSEREPPFGHRDREADRHHRGADVGRHVVGPLGAVAEIAHRGIGGGRDEAAEERLEVVAHVGSAFSWIRSEQEVWRTKSVRSPVPRTQAATSPVNSWRPGPRVPIVKTVCAGIQNRSFRLRATAHWLRAAATDRLPSSRPMTARPVLEALPVGSSEKTIGWPPRRGGSERRKMRALFEPR